jgi:hypothetical protein
MEMAVNFILKMVVEDGRLLLICVETVSEEAMVDDLMLEQLAPASTENESKEEHHTDPES